MHTTSRILLILWLASAAGLVLLAVMNVDPQIRMYYSNVIQTLVSFISGALCITSSNVFPAQSPLRTAWKLIGAGIIAWAAGSSIFSGYPLLNNGAETPYPYYSDIAFLLTSPLIVLGLYLFKRAADLDTPAFGLILSLAVLIAAAYWGYIGNAEGMEDPSITVKLVSMGYAFFDPILLAFGVLIATSFRGGLVGRAWWYVLGGILLYYIANQVYSYLSLKELYQTGSLIDLGWIIGYGLIGCGALTTRKMME